jgi:hypothetical protein
MSGQPSEDRFSRIRQIRTKRILVAAALVILIGLMVSYGFFNYPQGAVQVLSYDRQFADKPSDEKDFWGLEDQLKLQNRGVEMSFHVVDWSSDVSQWLFYHKDSLIIDFAVSANFAISNPAVAIVILDSDGFIRGYKLVDLTDFADTRGTEQASRSFIMPTSFSARSTFSFLVPSDMKTMKIWLLLYTVNPDNSGFAKLTQNTKYQHIVSKYDGDVLATQDLVYTFVSYQELSRIIAGSFFTAVAVFGIMFDLFVIKRIRPRDPIYPFLVYFLIFAVGVILMFWYFFHSL